MRLDLSVNQGEFEPQCASVKLLSLVKLLSRSLCLPLDSKQQHTDAMARKCGFCRGLRVWRVLHSYIKHTWEVLYVLQQASMRNCMRNSRGVSDGIQEVGLIHSSVEASNDCGAKGLA